MISHKLIEISRKAFDKDEKKEEKKTFDSIQCGREKWSELDKRPNHKGLFAECE